MNRSVLKKLLAQKYWSPAHYLCTWSPLANAFNTRPIPRSFDLDKNVGLFNVPELQSYEGFEILKEKCIIQADRLIKEAVSDRRSRKMVEVFDELSDSLCKVADLAEFIRLAHPVPLFSRAAESACGATSGIVEKLNTDTKLYNALRHVVKNGDTIPTDKVDKHVAGLFLFDFEQCGIHLPESNRHKVVALNDTILQLGQQFVASAANARVIKKNSVPEFVKNVFSVEGDNVIVQSLNADSSNPIIRELSYRVFLHPDYQQEYLLTELLKARYDLAVTCGFPTYAHRALNGSMLESPSSVMEFLDILSRDIKDRAEEDFKVMDLIKKSEYPTSAPLSAWDVPYYTHKIKREQFKVASSEYSPYFSLGACMEGLNILLNHLYGISLENAATAQGETWVDDVYKLAVKHETEGLLGYIYCDFYERSGKPNQDCHFTIRGGKVLSDGSYQQPIVVVMLNLPLPRWSSPSLLSPGMVDNLFHEMGHAMHSMLARTSYQHVTGTRCSTDFAEVPSVLMEYFASDPRVLKRFARHFQTKEMIPDEMLQRLCASKNLFMASEMQLQIFYSILDQLYHGTHPLKGTTTEVLAEAQNKYYNLEYVPNTAWQLRFSHLFGYGAKYYSYLVSKALASWIWQTYFEKDPFCRTQGERYRRECLAHGGGKPPWQLVADFLQREPTPSRLAESLVHEIDTKLEKLDCLKDIYEKIK